MLGTFQEEKKISKSESEINSLEKERDDFSSYRAVLNSKVTVGIGSTLLRDKLGIGGKI